MEKLHKLREIIREESVDGMLITNGQNRRYMTGFTGTAGVVLVTEDEAVFITDFRYTEQAKDQVKGFTIVEHKGPVHVEVATQVEQLGIKKLGFEKQDLTYAIFELYKNALKSEFVPVNGLVEKLRIVKSDEELAIMKEAAKLQMPLMNISRDSLNQASKKLTFRMN